MALLAWAVVLLIGAAGASLTAKVGVGDASSDPVVERSLEAASRLALPSKLEASSLALADARLAVWRPRDRPAPIEAADLADAPPSRAEKLLRVAMLAAPTVDPAPTSRTRGLGALSALEAALPAPDRPGAEFSAYGELAPDIFATRRLTILQLGDSHTAADYFTGRVRERLQQVFGSGGMAYIVPGKPHLGVRSALFESDASEGWTYEALQKSDEKRRFYLSGFNAVARRAGASLSLRARGGLPYNRLEVAFLKQPGGGRAEVLVDGEPGGQIDLDGAADERATLDLQPSADGPARFPRHRGARAQRRAGDGDRRRGRSRRRRRLLHQPGFPRRDGAIAAKARHRESRRRLAAAGAGYRRARLRNQRRLQRRARRRRLFRSIRADRAKAPGASAGPARHHDRSARRRARGARGAQPVAADGAGQCRLPTPPKLAQVREAQRRLAERIGADFWDWSSVMPGPCGAQVWAAANPPLMAHDFVHMTLEGYKQSADRFADFLIPRIDGPQTSAHVVSNN